MSLQPKRLAEEGVPVAAILLFWTTLAVLAEYSPVRGSVSTAGIVMAGLYVVVRGVALSDVVEPLETESLEAIIRENIRVAVPAGAWFLGGVVVYLAYASVLHFGFLDEMSAAVAGAGLGVVGLYAVAVGVATFDSGIRGDALGRRRDAANRDDEAPADD